MQKEKTLQFWDDYHRRPPASSSARNAKKEWIVPPSDALLRCLVPHFRAAPPAPIGEQQSPNHQKNDDDDTNHQDDNILRVLEIGCGTSSLAADLCDFWEQKDDPPPQRRLHVLATDASPVCIEQQRQRQQQVMNDRPETSSTSSCSSSSSSAPCCTRTTRLEYRVLNITEPHPELNGGFDVILDKGCLDTCLFRSKNKKNDLVVDTVLRHLHAWLRPPPTQRSVSSSVLLSNDDDEKDSGGGVYCLVTPRRKLPVVRDLADFAVTRTVLPACEFAGGNGSLEPRSGVQHQTCSDRYYLYVCRRIDPELNNSTQTTVSEHENNFESCHKCGLSFEDFLSRTKRNRTLEYWKRHWKAHEQHCKKEGAADDGEQQRV